MGHELRSLAFPSDIAVSGTPLHKRALLRPLPSRATDLFLIGPSIVFTTHFAPSEHVNTGIKARVGMCPSETRRT